MAQLFEVIGQLQVCRYNVRVTIARYIGQYRILRKIGAGGMGLVFLGEHTLLGRRAAIKTLLPAVSANPEIVERFFNEARATSAISDPGVIQIFDFGYHVDGTAYIVMELLEGEALSARIDRLGRLPLAEALRIAWQITGSLAVAHAHAIVHRDLKPDNIFLVSDAAAQGGERTKILDFGICKVGTGNPTLTQSGTMVGTPDYMSPEQCRGAGDVDHRADIYAFGCLLFHMLTGRPPFLGDVSGELIVAHLEQDPPAPSRYVAELPLAVDALLLRCLAKSPDDRYQSMTELQRVLGELYAEREAVEPTVPTAPPAVPLGKGFRSVYDGNFPALSDGSSHELPAPATPGLWPRRWSSPASSMMPATISSAQDAIDVLPPRRTWGRAVLACVLVAGVAIGLLATSHVGYSDDRGDAGASRPVTLPVEAAPAAAVPAVRTMPPGPVVPVVPDPAASTAIAPPGATKSATVDRARRRGASMAASYAIDPPRSSREAPDESPAEAKRIVAPPRPRPAAPIARPPTPPSEDLYDTR